MEGKRRPEETARSSVYAKAQQLLWKSFCCDFIQNHSVLFGNGRLALSRLTSACFEQALWQIISLKFFFCVLWCRFNRCGRGLCGGKSTCINGY